MAHWIIEETGLTEKEDVFRCSECGKEYTCGEIAVMDFGGPMDPMRCPNCGAVISGGPKIISGEEINRRKFVKCCDALLNVFENIPKDIVVLSIEKYDKIMSDLVKLGEDVEAANRDKERMLNLIKYIRLNEEFAKKIIPGTGKFIEEEISLITMNRKIYCCFEIERE